MYVCVRVFVSTLLLSFAVSLFGSSTGATLWKQWQRGRWGRRYSRCRVLGHNLFSIGHRFLHLHFHVRVVRGFLAFAVANLNDVFHPQQQVSNICNSFYACFLLLFNALRFASANCFSFLYVCVLWVFCTPPKKMLWLCDELRCVCCVVLPSVRGLLEFRINKNLILTVLSTARLIK